MTVLVTGAAGCVGYSVAKRLMDAGRQVVGVDNFTPYYDVTLKEARWAHLESRNLFHASRLNLADKAGVMALCEETKPTEFVYLAAQPGVRYGLDNPDAYVESNLIGFMNMLEAARALKPKHFVFASTSSVYGAGT